MSFKTSLSFLLHAHALSHLSVWLSFKPNRPTFLENHLVMQELQ